MMLLNDICPDRLAKIAQSGSVRVMKNALLNVAHALRASRVTTSADTGTQRECLQDMLSHFDDFYDACDHKRTACAAVGNGDDASYWQHQLDVLIRMKAQAESALTADKSK